MEKMTVQDLKCKLYIETLCEQYQNRDFMFTIIGEKRLKETKAKIESRLEVVRKNMENDPENYSFSYIEEKMKSFREMLVSRNIPKRMDEDFCIAVLFACWENEFAKDNPSDLALVNSLQLRELALDFNQIVNKMVIDAYSPYLLHNRSLDFAFYGGAKDLILGYEGWNGKDVLEIDTDFYSDSTKMMSDEYDFLISKIIRDLNESESKVMRFNAEALIPQDEKYSLIIARVSSCPCQTLEEFESFYSKLTDFTGRIILLDDKKILASKEKYAFRKKLIDENLLDIFLGGERVLSLDESGDIYILYSSSQTESTKFNFVGGHNSCYKNMITAHQKLSKSDVESVDYDFHAASDLIPGQKGKAYSFRDLFSVPKSGVEERKMSGAYHVFQMKDMPTNSYNFVKESSQLDVCEISGWFKIVTKDKVIFYVGDSKIQVAFLRATSECPAYVGGQFIVLDLNTELLTPEYLYILYAKGIFESLFDSASFDREYFHYTDCDIFDDAGNEILITPETKTGYIQCSIQIPSKDIQRKEIEDAQFVNASVVNRERALEQLLAEKTWLNEMHIRNIKHRIGNELVPVKTDLDAFSKLFQNHPEGVTLNTVRGKNEKVSEILERLSRDVDIISESLQDLTRTIDKNDLKPVDIITVVKDFVRDSASDGLFKFSLKVPEEHIIVNGSSNMIRSIMRNIVDNAVRHGFVDKTKGDYTIEVSITQDGNGNCVLCIKNNGAPMSELARDNYFKRGGIAGNTGHSGIGGADVKDTVNAMGGEVTLPIDENGWAVCIRISLPILNVEKI